MSNRRPSGDGSRRLAILFLAVVVPPAVALVWLGLRFLQQDQALLARGELERRQTSAQSAINTLDRMLSSAERWFTESLLPEDVVRFTVSARGVEPYPSDRVMWVPVPRAMPEAATREFDDAEMLEYRGEGQRALERYDALTRSGSSTVLAGALLRAARVHRRERRIDATLAAYRRLAAIADVTIDGMPADLVARRTICDVLAAAGRSGELTREAATLTTDFLGGRWTLDRAAWELTASQLGMWTGTPLPLSAHKSAFSAIAEWLHEERQHRPASSLAVTKRVVTVNSTPVTMLIRASAPGELTALAILPPLVTAWLRESRGVAVAGGDVVSLMTDDGQLVAGVGPKPGDETLKQAPSFTGLPWTLVLVPGESSTHALALSRRRQLLLAGLVAIVALLSTGSFMLWRVIQRDLTVARLQTDFVAAVSHEFRTPLASLRHVTELLEEDDALPVERRHAFYRVLGRNTERLHRLVESLLDFARMEDGRRPYELKPLDLTRLTEQVVDEFRQDAKADGFTIEFDSTNIAGAYSLVDAPSLTCALWNLLDNAVKFSLERRAIRVSVERLSTGVAIAVRDAGLGIPRAEQQEVFRKFVRGQQAARLGIKGAGLGLAMVDHIVRAHGGAIELESQEGVGSTFRLVLPAVG